MADIKDFRLPDLGEGLEEGEIVEWFVEVGETIELNAPVASVETAKAVVEVPSPFAGTVVARLGEVGETLEVGTVFLRIEVGGEGGAVQDTLPAGGDAEEQAEPQPLVGYGQRGGGGRRRRRRRGSEVAAVAADVAGHGVPDDTDEPATVPLAKPPVRKLAKDLGVDLADIGTGSGPDGVITREDVRAAAAQRMVADQAPAPPPPPAVPSGERRARDEHPDRTLDVEVGAVPGFRGRRPGEVEAVGGVRKRIIAKMEQSRREIPHALCSRDADVTELWRLKDLLTVQAREDGLDVRISPTSIVMRATVLALRRFPTLNARYDEQAGEIRLLEDVHLGCAVDTDRGLMVPNVKHAEGTSLLQLAAETARLAQACRDGSVTPAELTGGTFTVDNYGSFGNDDGNPIINHPEAGILGVGAMRERPWVHDGEVVPRRVARFTLAFDHRVCDGGEAGRFVTYVADLCEDPARILLHA